MHLPFDRFSCEDLSELSQIAEVVQDDHTSFGGALLKQWGFDDNLVAIAAKHEGPEFASGTDMELLIVNLANNLTRKLGYSLLKEEIDLWQLDSARQLGVDQGTLDEIGEEVDKQVQASGGMFN